MMKRFYKVIIILVILHTFINMSCKKEYEYKITGINLSWTNETFGKVDVFTKESGIILHAKTITEYIAYYGNSSSDCYATTQNIDILNPIDTSTMLLYCDLNMIISNDTLSNGTNILKDPRISQSIYRYEDKYGGYAFEISRNNGLYSELDFQIPQDSNITFIFSAKTIDNIDLIDSIKLKIDWK